MVYVAVLEPATRIETGVLWVLIRGPHRDEQEPEVKSHALPGAWIPGRGRGVLPVDVVEKCLGHDSVAMFVQVDVGFHRLVARAHVAQLAQDVDVVRRFVAW